MCSNVASMWMERGSMGSKVQLCMCRKSPGASGARGGSDAMCFSEC